jgi:hypothetical protein
MLRTFARCVEPDDAKRAVLLDGEPGTVSEPLPAVDPPLLDAADAKADALAQQEQANRDKPLDNDKQDKKGKKAKADNPPPPPPAPPPPSPLWSEPFADLNGNKQHDDGEPYLDTDRDKAFTVRLVVNDPNGNGKRDIGLLERYRLHAWGRQVISVVTLDEVMAVPAAAESAPAADSAPAAATGSPPAQ